MGVNIILFSLKSPPSFWMYSTDMFIGLFMMGFASPCFAAGQWPHCSLAFFQVTSKYLAGFQLVFSLMDWVSQAWSIKAQE